MVLRSERVRREYEFPYRGSNIWMRFQYIDGDPMIQIYDSSKHSRVGLKASLSIDLGYGSIDQSVYDYLRKLGKDKFQGKDHSELKKLLDEIPKKKSKICIGINSDTLEKKV